MAASGIVIMLRGIILDDKKIRKDGAVVSMPYNITLPVVMSQPTTHSSEYELYDPEIEITISRTHNIRVQYSPSIGAGKNIRR